MRLIDADALENVVIRLNENGRGITRNDFKLIDSVIFEFPTIEERKTGQWIVQKDASGKTYGECSACHYKQYAGMLKYCPECGARMEVEQSIDDKVADLPSEAYYNKDWKSDMISRQAAVDAQERKK